MAQKLYNVSKICHFTLKILNQFETSLGPSNRNQTIWFQPEYSQTQLFKSCLVWFKLSLYQLTKFPQHYSLDWPSLVLDNVDEALWAIPCKASGQSCITIF